ncbi:MAG: MBL fold metallo-hydrolase [Gammaproteobacteria bacterium]|nr:MBL fold metallo-hydrolase [Gammaproteobacteria bacterium]
MSKFVIFSLILFTSFLISETKLIILGSGTPNPDPERYGSGYAVVVNDDAYIVDFGPGIVRRISAMSPTWGGEFSSMELENINIAFLTHIHSDHTGALADLILTPWIMGRDEPLNLYGPKGLKLMSKNITEAYIDDINYRLYGSQPANELGFTTNVTEISEDGTIFKDKNVEVIAFKNAHGDFKNSFGFLFISEDKKILFSGDTAVSENLIKYGTDLDILVHEVFSSETFVNKTKDWQIYHQAHHTSSIDLGIIADKLQPKKLVLSHILFWGASEESLLKDIRKNFNGQAIVAKDLMVIE